jgi:hypothetical protein
MRWWAAGIMTEIIKRGEALPRKNVEMKLCTVTDDQEAVLVQVDLYLSLSHTHTYLFSLPL